MPTTKDARETVSAARRRPGTRNARLGTTMALVGALACHPAHAGVLEVLHSWDGEFDGAAVAVLRNAVNQEGHTWQDFTIVGGGGNGMATAILDSRVMLGNPPSVAQVRTPTIVKWAQLGKLANLGPVAKAENWDSLLPPPVRTAMQYNGQFVAVPVTVHRLNWLWINAEALRRAGATVPTTWDQFFDTAEKLQRAGYLPIAHGGEQWQDVMLFQTVVLGVGGVDFYKKALQDFDLDALSGPTMVRALLTFRRIKQYTQWKGPSRRWIRASELLIKGKAGMQFMGDWAKPVFLQAQARSGFVFECVPAPGTDKQFLFTTDAFAFFRLTDTTSIQAQQAFASLAMSRSVQAEFNQIKGGISARLDTDSNPGDRCGEIASIAYRRAAQNGNLVPSMAMSTSPGLELALPEIVSEFWRDDRVKPAATISRLVQAVRRYR
jgi:glucose/mannose transport system substrate-binding protein